MKAAPIAASQLRLSCDSTILWLKLLITNIAETAKNYLATGGRRVSAKGTIAL